MVVPKRARSATAGDRTELGSEGSKQAAISDEQAQDLWRPESRQTDDNIAANSEEENGHGDWQERILALFGIEPEDDKSSFEQLVSYVRKDQGRVAKHNLPSRVRAPDEHEVESVRKKE